MDFNISFQDLNPIENLWHELKHFIRTKCKPKTRADLEKGLQDFWNQRISVEKCTKYIHHLKKVLPMVILRGGAATGF